ncbi:Gfo/Idh/MocA family protein [Planctomicrobium piriforme]|uniref:Gfo/Idh/MocA family protein n=1 Tax=Planctomicrobium piriforme TaxID=1576369 RepID=UPI001FE51911|nr:Gfo/Idh/MocA family oxidoreductase [Planctomicrobium piriforme]
MAHAETPKPRIRVGQIGVGHAHATKLSVYRNSPDYEVVGIAEPDPQLRRRAETTAAYRGLPWMTPEELVRTPGLQAVLVETEVRHLLDTAEMCIDAGQHVHLDKPAGTSLPQFERILKNAERQGLMVQLGYMYRYSPGVILLREFLRQGWLGEIFEVDAVMSKVIDPVTRRQLAEFSGGTMFELGGHLVDLVVGILGAPEKVTPLIQHSSPIADDLNDNGLAMLAWPKANATIRSSAQEVDGFRRRHLVVCGTEGTFQIQPLDDPAVILTLAEPRGEYVAGTHTISLPKFHRYVADAADMARIIRGEKPSDFSYEHERIVQRTLLQCSNMPV